MLNKKESTDGRIEHLIQNIDIDNITHNIASEFMHHPWILMSNPVIAAFTIIELFRVNDNEIMVNKNIVENIYIVFEAIDQIILDDYAQLIQQLYKASKEIDDNHCIKWAGKFDDGFFIIRHKDDYLKISLDNMPPMLGAFSSAMDNDIYFRDLVDSLDIEEKFYDEDIILHNYQLFIMILERVIAVDGRPDFALDIIMNNLQFVKGIGEIIPLIGIVRFEPKDNSIAINYINLVRSFKSTGQINSHESIYDICLSISAGYIGKRHKKIYVSKMSLKRNAILTVEMYDAGLFEDVSDDWTYNFKRITKNRNQTDNLLIGIDKESYRLWLNIRSLYLYSDSLWYKKALLARDITIDHILFGRNDRFIPDINRRIPSIKKINDARLNVMLCDIMIVIQ